MKLNDKELISELKELNNKENELLVQILDRLAEVVRRDLHLKQGLNSMFSFCTQVLHYSESAACRRIKVARLITRFPQIREKLLSKAVNLSTLSLAAKGITSENIDKLLDEISWKSQSEVETILVAKFSTKAVKKRECIRPTLRKRSSPKKQSSLQEDSLKTSLFANSLDRLDQAAVTSEQEEETEVCYKLSFSVSNAAKEKFDRVREKLSNKYPQGASLESAFEELLDWFLETPRKSRKKKAARVSRASSEKPSRYIPLEVKKCVAKRDGQSCSYISQGGIRCGSRWQLEFDHITPYSIGGSNEPENIRLLCRNHNTLQAREYFGDKVPRTIVTTAAKVSS